MLLLHGFLTDSRMWLPQLEALSDGYKVIAWDAPGAGGSHAPVDGFAFSDWARLLARFMDAISVESAHLVGLSWGGVLAQEFWRMYPERVDRLVLADTYLGWLGSFGPDVARQRLDRCTQDARLPSTEFLERWVPHVFSDRASTRLIEQTASVMADFDPAGFIAMASSLAETDTTEVVKRIDVPTLLIWGELDERSPLEVAKRIAALAPAARLVLIPDAGHVSNLEQPDRFTEAVLGFLEE